MQINISNLSEGVHTYDLSAEAGKLGLESNLSGMVGASVTLEKSMNQLLLTITASVKGVFVCDRCADEFEKEITTTFNSVYSWENTEEMEDEDDFYILRPDDNIIDISESVREYLSIAVPLKLECGRPECEIPLPPKKEDEEIDPRWEQLKKLIS